MADVTKDAIAVVDNHPEIIKDNADIIANMVNPAGDITDVVGDISTETLSALPNPNVPNVNNNVPNVNNNVSNPPNVSQGNTSPDINKILGDITKSEDIKNVTNEDLEILTESLPSDVKDKIKSTNSKKRKKINKILGKSNKTAKQISSEIDKLSGK